MSAESDIAALQEIVRVIAMARPRANETILKIAEVLISPDADKRNAAMAKARASQSELRSSADLLSGIAEASDFDRGLFNRIAAHERVNSSTIDDIRNLADSLSELLDLMERDLVEANVHFSGASADVLDTIRSINVMLQDLAALADEWRTEADGGLAMISSVDGALEDMAKLSDSISMLAINASIEANRAGEQGGAFGVLAQEMHRQATQSRQTLEKARSAMGRGITGRI
ncbi:MAG: methyl-accepting chemotaxis protein [Pseudomonadota bacterium]